MNNKKRNFLNFPLGKQLAVLGIVLLVFLLAIALLFIRQSTEGKVIVDLSDDVGKVKLSYGANEDDNWIEFVSNVEIQKLHQDVGTEYIRVHINNIGWREDNTFPLRADGTYDFSNLDRFVDAVLSIGAIPFVTFDHFSIEGTEGHGDPPVNDGEFADYVEVVVNHLSDLCKGYLGCDVNDWYFEIWNEPYHEDWWKEDRYSKMFNLVYSRIKKMAPKSKVGGPSGAYVPGLTSKMELFLESSDPDFVSVHHYGNILRDRLSNQERMDDIKTVYFDALVALKQLVDKDVEVVNSEYSVDHTFWYMRKLDRPFVGAWYASALIAQIKSQVVDMELFYSGTSNSDKGGFGMWGPNKLFPAYYVKKEFVKYNTFDSTILISQSSKNVDVLVVENSAGKFITLVNKVGKKNEVSIQFIAGAVQEIVDGGRAYTDDRVILEPYEVKFLRLV